MTSSERVVGVYPARVLGERPRLMAALKLVSPVALIPLEAVPERNLDGAIVVGEMSNSIEPFAGMPILRLADRDPSRGRTGVAEMIGASLNPVLRGRSLPESHTGGASLGPVDPAEEVLATCDAQPVWVKSRGGLTVWRASLTPRELAPTESLRDLFLEGEFLSLLPVVDFLRHVGSDVVWQDPPLRATVVFDDPNLHWHSYGHIHFGRLAEHARSRRYHATFATIPLDAWFVHPGVARTFRTNRNVLSLTIHGNDHHGAELAEGISIHAARRLATQAVRRIERLERRTQLSVGRVMIAPHDEYGHAAAQALVEVGIAAACTGFGRRRETLPVADWMPGDWDDGGLPRIPRRPLKSSRGELVLRAYLGQPIVVYGHHSDAADDFEFVAETVDDVNRFGDVEWMSLQRLASTNAATRTSGSTFSVRLYSRSVEVDVPPGIATLRVELPPGVAPRDDALVVNGDEQMASIQDGGAEIDAPPGRVRIALMRVPEAQATARPRRFAQPQALARRIATETRDRLSVLR